MFEKQEGHRPEAPKATHYSEAVMRAREAKITKMMFAIVLAFSLIWIPLFAIIFATRASLGTLPRDVSMMVSYASNISSLINPVLYAVMNRSYRNEFKDILWSIIDFISERCECFDCCIY